jgi:hypothetical protein
VVRVDAAVASLFCREDALAEVVLLRSMAE